MNFSDAQIGLCSSCAHVAIIATRRGSKFYLCRLAERDALFPKYPRLPVLTCAGYELNDKTKEKTDK